MKTSADTRDSELHHHGARVERADADFGAAAGVSGPRGDV
jgi:hypothetical protein